MWQLQCNVMASFGHIFQIHVGVGLERNYTHTRKAIRSLGNPLTSMTPGLKKNIASLIPYKTIERSKLESSDFFFFTFLKIALWWNKFIANFPPI